MDKKDKVFVTKWRHWMGWIYGATIIFDFMIAPVGWVWLLAHFPESLFKFVEKADLMWSPLTLQGGGLYHVAMGAILGITSWSRGKENIAGVTETQKKDD